MSEILSVNNIQLSYGEQAVLQGVDFSLQQGEILCLLGPSGCGKTTVLKSVAGLLNINAGTIKLNDQIVSGAKVSVAPEKRNLGMLFQDYALFPHLNVADNITYGIYKLSKADKQARLTELLELVHLTGQEHKYPHQLSGGQQQRVALARALAYQPDLLLLDEPFSNIDNKVKFELIEHVRDIIKQANVAAVFVSHSKEEAYAFADKVALLNQGKVEQLGAPHELYLKPVNRFVADFMGPLNQFVLNALPNCWQERVHTQLAGDLNGYQYLYVRPEHIQITNKNPTQETSDVLTATVKHSRFVGSHFKVIADYQDTSIVLSLPQNLTVNLGDTINITLDTVNAIWLD